MLVLYFKNDKASLDRSKAQIVNISALRCTLFSETKNLSLNDETETERISMMRLGKRCQNRDSHCVLSLPRMKGLTMHS